MILKKLLIGLKHSLRLDLDKKQVLEETNRTELSSIASNWSKAKNLYEALRKRCHPDLFAPQLREKATTLFQQIEQNKFKYDQLLLIEQEAQEQLGIQIDE